MRTKDIGMFRSSNLGYSWNAKPQDFEVIWRLFPLQCHNIVLYVRLLKNISLKCQ
jgi:hypothetical protein